MVHCSADEYVHVWDGPRRGRGITRYESESRLSATESYASRVVLEAEHLPLLGHGAVDRLAGRVDLRNGDCRCRQVHCALVPSCVDHLNDTPCQGNTNMPYD